MIRSLRSLRSWFRQVYSRGYIALQLYKDTYTHYYARPYVIGQRGSQLIIYQLLKPAQSVILLAALARTVACVCLPPPPPQHHQ